MSWRGFFVALALVVGGLVNAVLLLDEDIAEADPRTTPDTGRLDPLFDVKYTEANRRANIVRFGFDEQEAQAVAEFAAALARRYRVGEGDRDLVRSRLEASPEPEDLLTAAFCGTGAALPVRYAALRYLVTEDANGLRHPVDLELESGIEYQDWARTARLDAVYQAAERRRNRPPDATRMALAAILGRQEETLLEGREPWGVGWLASWSWARAAQVEPGLGQRVSETVALLHLVLESTSGEGGLCPG